MQSFRCDNYDKIIPAVAPRYLQHGTAVYQSIKGSYSFARLRYYCHACECPGQRQRMSLQFRHRACEHQRQPPASQALRVCVWSTAVSMADANCRPLLARREMQKRGHGAVKLLMLSVRRNHHSVHDGDRCLLVH